MKGPNISIGDHISNTGSNATLIYKSTVISAFKHIQDDRGDAAAQALQDVMKYIVQAGNETANAHLDLLLQELARHPNNAGIVKTLWYGIVTAIPAIASLPAAVAFVTNVLKP